MEKVFKSEFKVSNCHKLLFELFSSYLLSMILVASLMVLVYLGTLAQTTKGIYEVQKMFFDSVFFMYPLSESFSIPLPGGYLILALLLINIICGGIIRLKFSKRTLGIIIIHIGVIYLLLAGLVSFHFAQYGFIRLNEGESTDYFESWNDWDLLITEFNGEETSSQRLPLSENLTGETFVDSSQLPFKISILQYAKNATVIQSNGNNSIGGFDIKFEALDKDAARNVPAIKLSLNEKKLILWGSSILPHVEKTENGEIQFRVARKKQQLPFKISLKKFNMELHPNTDSASAYESLVKINDASESLIQMNEPLRKNGVAVFQSSYEKHGAGSNVLYTSVFSTVVNPSDQWPLYACIVLSIGLLVHFIPMLIKYIKRGSETK